MLPEEPIVPGEWYRIAERDLDRAQRMLQDDDYEGTGFYLQQAVEKYVKGFLLTKGWRLRKTHDLEKLLNEAVQRLPALEPFRKFCVSLTQYYVVERYPGEISVELTRAEMEEGLAQARALIRTILQAQ